LSPARRPPPPPTILSPRHWRPLTGAAPQGSASRSAARSPAAGSLARPAPPPPEPPPPPDSRRPRPPRGSGRRPLCRERADGHLCADVAPWRAPEAPIAPLPRLLLLTAPPDTALPPPP